VQSVGNDSVEGGVDFMAEQLMESFRMGNRRDNGKVETPVEEEIRRAGKDFFERAYTAIDACAPLFDYMREIDQEVLPRLQEQVRELREAVDPELRREGGRKLH
jgi:hypothetical protein